eukprot:TRINITY_DN610_c1_g1_i4.p2 TRINITY_DN610_c1_g1~~TRINITY_DN610_c1_g1_i4.p2  ORF type:complete len:650 (-),score=215.59 TRINITY_DN610_c1_g1_i4:422-2371(-)
MSFTRITTVKNNIFVIYVTEAGKITRWTSGIRTEIPSKLANDSKVITVELKDNMLAIGMDNGQITLIDILDVKQESQILFSVGQNKITSMALGPKPYSLFVGTESGQLCVFRRMRNNAPSKVVLSDMGSIVYIAVVKRVYYVACQNGEQIRSYSNNTTNKLLNEWPTVSHPPIKFFWRSDIVKGTFVISQTRQVHLYVDDTNGKYISLKCKNQPLKLVSNIRFMSPEVVDFHVLVLTVIGKIEVFKLRSGGSDKVALLSINPEMVESIATISVKDYEITDILLGSKYEQITLLYGHHMAPIVTSFDYVDKSGKVTDMVINPVNPAGESLLGTNSTSKGTPIKQQDNPLINQTSIVFNTSADGSMVTGSSHDDTSEVSFGELLLSKKKDSKIALPAEPQDKLDTVEKVLVQALRSRDDDLLDSVIKNSSTEVVKKTVENLEPAFTLQFIQALTRRFEEDPAKAAGSVRWIQECIQRNAAYLAGLNKLPPFLNKFYRLLNARVTYLPDLIQLEGRLSLVLSQIEASNVNITNKVVLNPENIERLNVKFDEGMKLMESNPFGSDDDDEEEDEEDDGSDVDDEEDFETGDLGDEDKDGGDDTEDDEEEGGEKMEWIDDVKEQSKPQSTKKGKKSKKQQVGDDDDDDDVDEMMD